MLTRVYPPAVVDAAIAATGKNEQRRRLLPARVVMYGVMAMALFSEDSYEEVMRRVVDGLSWLADWRTSCAVPTKAAISKARERLGTAPPMALFKSVVRPLASRGLRGVWYRGWRLMSFDCATLDVADTPENAGRFGKAATRRGEGSTDLPQLRLAALAENGTHAIVDVAIGPGQANEADLKRQILRSLHPDMLCLSRCTSFSLPLWQEAAKSDAELLWQVPDDQVFTVVRELPDGSYISRIYASEYDSRQDHGGSTVRIIDCGCPHGEMSCRLVCTILDPDVAPAAELARLYCTRWTFDRALEELKSMQGAPRLVLRSRTPDGVIQEIYGYLLTHYAIRTLVYDSEVPDAVPEISGAPFLPTIDTSHEPSCGGCQRMGCRGCPFAPQAHVVIRGTAQPIAGYEATMPPDGGVPRIPVPSAH